MKNGQFKTKSKKSFFSDSFKDDISLVLAVVFIVYMAYVVFSPGGFLGGVFFSSMPDTTAPLKAVMQEMNR